LIKIAELFQERILPVLKKRPLFPLFYRIRIGNTLKCIASVFVFLFFLEAFTIKIITSIKIGVKVTFIIFSPKGFPIELI